MPVEPGILDAFREAAGRGETVVAERRGDSWTIRAVAGAVASTALPANDADTRDLFVQGLYQRFGTPIGSEVARQLGLAAAGDQVLEAKAVLAALDMATASQEAMAGLNFISRNAIRAQSLSPQFRVVCMALGLIPDRIDPVARAAADSRFSAKFDERADADRRAVDLIEARMMMAEVLSEILAKE